MRNTHTGYINTQFLQGLYKEIRKVTFVDASEEYCKNFIRQCVDNELNHLNQIPCEHNVKGMCYQHECTKTQ